MSKEAMKLALEALESCGWNDGYAGENQYFHDDLVDKAIAALREAQPAQQEPFGYFKAEPFGWTDCAESDEGAVALYERPQPAQRTWVGLTDAERIMCRSYDPEEAVAKTEAKLKEKNT